MEIAFRLACEKLPGCRRCSPNLGKICSDALDCLLSMPRKFWKKFGFPASPAADLAASPACSSGLPPPPLSVSLLMSEVADLAAPTALSTGFPPVALSVVLLASPAADLAVSTAELTLPPLAALWALPLASPAADLMESAALSRGLLVGLTLSLASPATDLAVSRAVSTGLLPAWDAVSFRSPAADFAASVA